jgi:branched-subunit amino acid transport protein AzlD
LFSIFRASAFIILFIEVPLLLRICPTSSTFDATIRRVSTNYTRAGAYAVMGAVQLVSVVDTATSLIAAGVILLLTALCYLLAAVKGQAFVGSKTLGGQGVAQMIV